MFWGSLSVALVIAGAVALPVNRWLIARGKGHVAVHNTGIHGGPPTRVVGAVAVVAAVFGTVVLTAEAINSDGGHMDGEAAPSAEAVRGLAVSNDGMTLALGKTEVPRNREGRLSFRILGASGEPVREFEVEHERRMHLIVVRRDLTGFQHLHPELEADGTWHTSLRIPQAGNYRVFADFKHEGEAQTLAADLAVDGTVDWKQLPAESDTAHTDGYEVRMDGGESAGREADLQFTVLRDGEPVAVQQYLGAGGHLVALREGDLAYLHVHPAAHDADTDPVAFATEFPSEGRYRLFLQFKHEGQVHTAAFTRDISGAGDESQESGNSGGHHG
jgi:hypothetical protein